MASRKKATVYLDARLFRALRLRAKATDCTLSEVIADALRQLLSQEARAIQVVPPRPGPSVPLATVGALLKSRAKREGRSR